MYKLYNQIEEKQIYDDFYEFIYESGYNINSTLYSVTICSIGFNITNVLTITDKKGGVFEVTNPFMYYDDDNDNEISTMILLKDLKTNVRYKITKKH